MLRDFGCGEDERLTESLLELGDMVLQKEKMQTSADIDKFQLLSKARITMNKILQLKKQD